MKNGFARREPATLAVIRKMLLGTLLVGMLGTTGELILLGHVDMAAQWIPLVVFAIAALVLVWHYRRPSAASVRTLQGVMALFIATGALGVGLHLDGNIEFERELHPDERGLEFVRKSVAGATPVLAPGSMVLLGLVGLAHTYRHPSTAGVDTAGQEV